MRRCQATEAGPASSAASLAAHRVANAQAVGLPICSTHRVGPNADAQRGGCAQQHRIHAQGRQDAACEGQEQRIGELDSIMHAVVDRANGTPCYLPKKKNAGSSGSALA